MPTPPYAKIVASKNGGTFASGVFTLTPGDTLQLKGESTAGWQFQRWEIYAHPAGFSAPSGWTYDAPTGVIYSTDTQPAVITAPAINLWGKYLFRLVVNGGLRDGVAVQELTDDTGTAASMVSAAGLRDLAV